MCSRPVKIPKLDTDVLEPMPTLEETGFLNESDPLPVPTSSKSPQSAPIHSQSSNQDSSSEITLVLETPGMSVHINNTIKLQTIIDSLDEAMEDEIERVQKRFYRQKRPYFDERRAILERIPGFWRTTFLRHPDLASIMESLDKEILEHLYSVDVLEYSDGDCAYKISFFFNDNPFFFNHEFTKEVRLMDSDELVSIGTKIKWKEPYTSLNRRVKPGAKRGQDGYRCEFFFWFSSSNSKYLDKIGEILKDDIWPNPIKYFFQHSGSTEELVVLSDSDSENNSDQLQIETPIINNSDVINIDDDEEYELKSSGESVDGNSRALIPEQINGELTLLDTSQLVQTSIINNLPIDSEFSTSNLEGVNMALQPNNPIPTSPNTESDVRPPGVANISNTDNLRSTSFTSPQTQITIDIQQESEA